MLSTQTQLGGCWVARHWLGMGSPCESRRVLGSCSRIRRGVERREERPWLKDRAGRAGALPVTARKLWGSLSCNPMPTA
jgi:hypothetical protein